MADDSNIETQKNSLKNSSDYKRLLRARKRRIRRMKMHIAFFALTLVAAILIIVILNASGVFYKKADKTTLILNSDKTIVFEEIEKNDSLTSEKELSKYIKNLVKDYNSENDSDSVKVMDISLKDNEAYVRLKYKDYETYADFTGHDVYSGTVKSALKKGYDFETSFYPVSDGKFSDSVAPDEVTKEKKNKVLIVSEGVNIRLKSEKIKYVSTDGTTYVSESEISAEKTSDTEPTVYVIY